MLVEPDDDRTMGSDPTLGESTTTLQKASCKFIPYTGIVYVCLPQGSFRSGWVDAFTQRFNTPYVLIHGSCSAEWVDSVFLTQPACVYDTEGFSLRVGGFSARGRIHALMFSTANITLSTTHADVSVSDTMIFFSGCKPRIAAWVDSALQSTLRAGGLDARAYSKFGPYTGVLSLRVDGFDDGLHPQWFSKSGMSQGGWIRRLERRSRSAPTPVLDTMILFLRV